MEKSIFKARFRELYQKSGCSSITQFAQKLEMNRQSVDRYYNGKRCPDALALARICNKMNVSADWLLGTNDIDIKALSPDIKAAVMYTGQPENMIETVRTFSHTQIKALAMLVENREFPHLLDDFSLFLSLVEKNNNLPEAYGDTDNISFTEDHKIILSSNTARSLISSRVSDDMAGICRLIDFDKLMDLTDKYQMDPERKSDK